MSEEIFEQLRAKGYFDGPLTGYLSHQLPPDLPPWRAVLRLSVQVGLVGGFGMGVLFTAALLLFNPYLLYSPLETLKLFAGLLLGFSYLGCLFLCFTGMLQIGILRLLRKPLSIDHFLAFRLGELSGVLLFLYGACWWWTLAISPETYPLLSLESGVLLIILFGLALYVANLVNHLTNYRKTKGVPRTREVLLFASAMLIIFLLGWIGTGTMF